MKIYAFYILFMLLPSVVGAQTISWAPGVLEWSDFKAEVPQSSHQAETVTRITMNFSFRADTLFIDVQCRFHPHQSWTKNRENMALLNHEQRHFDITEWYARLLHQKLQEAQLNSRNFRQMVQKIFARHHKALAAIQQQYDRETHHGIKAAEQAEWDRKIDRALNRTKHLEDRPIVHVLR